jgi:hypothetical protein
MSLKREIEYLLKSHRWTRRMVVGDGQSMEIALHEFPYYVREMIYTNLYLPKIICLHEDHTHFQMQYDVLQSEYQSKVESFSMRDDGRMESSFTYVVQYLHDLLEVTGKNPEIREMLKRRYRKYFVDDGDEPAFDVEKNKEIYHQSTTSSHRK